MHLGNLMGAVLPFQKNAIWNDAAIFIADLHALTSVKNGDKLREQTIEVAIEYLAIFWTDTPITIFRQSDIKNITKLMWILTNVTPYSLMLRAHSFKEEDTFNKLKGRIDWLEKALTTKIEYNDEVWIGHGFGLTKTTEDIFSRIKNEFDEFIIERNEGRNDQYMMNMGVMNYPILMAADIIGYDIDAVPVGKDQIQHLEMTRDIARAFNKTYGKEVFREPEAIIEESVATLPGIDGRKMSKSYDNFIGIFDDDKLLKKRVMSIVTGSEWVDEKKKNPDECAIFSLYQVFATPEEIESMRKKYSSENIGFGYGHAKTMLLEVLTRFLTPYRARREALLRDIPFVEAKLAEGAKIMNARLDAKMQEVCEVVGVN